MQRYVLQDEDHLSIAESIQSDCAGLGELVDDQLLAAYRTDCGSIPYQFTGIYPTDGVILWGLIRRFRPNVVVETGTGRAVSSQILLKALRRYAPGSRFITIGESSPEAMATASEILAAYPECTQVEGRAPADLIPHLDCMTTASVGIFIDGPKGSSPEFAELLHAIFRRLRPEFVAVHDCEKHIPRGFDPDGKWPQGRINPTRAQLSAFNEQHLAGDYHLGFMDDAWCEANDALNAAVYGSGHGLSPYVYKGSRQRSHSPYLGVLHRLDAVVQGQAA